ALDAQDGPLVVEERAAHVREHGRAAGARGSDEVDAPPRPEVVHGLGLDLQVERARGAHRLSVGDVLRGCTRATVRGRRSFTRSTARGPWRRGLVSWRAGTGPARPKG